MKIKVFYKGGGSREDQYRGPTTYGTVSSYSFRKPGFLRIVNLSGIHFLNIDEIDRFFVTKYDELPGQTGG